MWSTVEIWRAPHLHNLLRTALVHGVHRQLIKNAIIDLLYQPTVRKWVIIAHHLNGWRVWIGVR